MIAANLESAADRQPVRRLRPLPGAIWPWLVLLAVALMVATPLTFLVLGSFSTSNIPGRFSLTTLGLDNYRQVWLDPDTYAVFGDTLIYVGGAASFSIVVAGILAWLTERTNMPGRIWIYAGVPMTLAMPGMLLGIAWILLLSPRIGFVNMLLQQALGLTTAPFNAYTLQGMILVEGLRLVPTAFLMLVPLLRSMDPALEEAAAMSGAPALSIMRGVTLRLMLPGILAVVIYQAMTALEVFEVPGILGLPGKTYVFSTRIYAALHTSMGTPEYGIANALAIIYVAISIIAIYFYSRTIGRSGRYAVISGKGYRPRLIDLGGWRWVGLSFCVLYLLLALIIPFLVLAYMSFLPFLQVPSSDALRMMSLNNYAALWGTGQIGGVLYNTLILVVATSTLTVAASFVISLAIVRSRFRGRNLLDQLSFLPHAFPGIVLGLAFLWVFLELDKIGVSIYGGVLTISIAFTVSFMAYGTRAMNAALLQIHKDLEEAAQISGAGSLRVLWRVSLPLMLPSMAGLWIWAMLQAVRQAGTPLILYEGAENQVLSVFIWEMWDHGNSGAVAATGVLTIIALLIVTFAFRALSFGRAAAGTGT
jgi:iron(III) transport system permease protein